MMLSEEMIQTFINEYDVRLTKETLDLYQKSVWNLLTFCDTSLNSITTRDIRNWILHLENNQYTSSTINSRLAGVKLFYKYCVDEEIVKESPAEVVPFLHLKDKLPYYLKMDQLMQLRKLVEGRLEERAVMELLYATGVRIRELVAIKLEDIDWSERIIRIEEGKRKKGRIVLFTRECSEHVKAYVQTKQDSTPFLFTNVLGTKSIPVRTIQRRFEVYEKKLGFRITPHTLRHTFAAHLAKKGMPLECIQTLLGHNMPHQTQLYARLYSHAQKEMYDEWM
jgi:site-specific recombinase XerD